MVKDSPSSWDKDIFPGSFKFDYYSWIEEMPDCPSGVKVIRQAIDKVKTCASKVHRSRYVDKPAAIDKFKKAKRTAEKMLRDYYNINVLIPNDPPEDVFLDIMAFTKIRTLENCRFVSRKWNKNILGKGFVHLQKDFFLDWNKHLPKAHKKLKWPPKYRITCPNGFTFNYAPARPRELTHEVGELPPGPSEEYENTLLEMANNCRRLMAQRYDK